MASSAAAAQETASSSRMQQEDQQNGASAAASSSEIALNYREIEYAMDSFYAIVKPVFVTMVLSAVAVVCITTPESSAAATEGLSVYYVKPSSEGDSTTTQFKTSLLNAFVIVLVICLVTFLIVILYKYRCMTCLIGYMILSSTLLLGYLASDMFKVAIDRYELGIDKLTFYVTMYNFAIVGVISIFGGPLVVPKYMSQAYLILTSVITAWQLSFFDPWTAWVLLVLLALYDLFAVLSPCGPLKFLVHLMQGDNAPDMPGLLYEATLPSAQRRQRRRNRTAANNANSSSTEPPSQDDEVSSDAEAAAESTTTTTANDDSEHHVEWQSHFWAAPSVYNAQGTATTMETDAVVTATTACPAEESESAQGPSVVLVEESVANNMEVESVEVPAVHAVLLPLRTGRIPFAIAKMYKLRFLHDPQPPWIIAANSLEQPEADVSYTPEQLQLEVDVVFPANGGRIVPTVSLESAPELYRRTQGTDEETRYTIIDYQGVHKRVVFVNNEGRIFEDLREQNAEAERKERTSIRLGLGDFIFYSILVSKAALYSYTTFVVCTLAILSGLGLTLLLLAAYGKALPALPISILLGVVFYLFTRYVMEPWVQDTFIERVYA